MRSEQWTIGKRLAVNQRGKILQGELPMLVGATVPAAECQSCLAVMTHENTWRTNQELGSYRLCPPRGVAAITTETPLCPRLQARGLSLPLPLFPRSRYLPLSSVCVCREQATSPPRVPAPRAPSLLMSPMVFTQPTCAPPKERDGGLLPLGSQEPAATSTSLLLPLPTPEPSVITSSPLTKRQLQEALLYLIQVGGPRCLSSSLYQRC